jgi:hypothetical protein
MIHITKARILLVMAKNIDNLNDPRSVIDEIKYLREQNVYLNSGIEIAKEHGLSECSRCNKWLYIGNSDSCTDCASVFCEECIMNEEIGIMTYNNSHWFCIKCVNVHKARNTAIF